MNFKPIFPDYYKVLVKFQSIVDKNPDLNLKVCSDTRAQTNAGRFIDIRWYNPYHLKRDVHGKYSLDKDNCHIILLAEGKPNLEYDMKVFRVAEIVRTEKLFRGHDDECRFVTGMKFDEFCTQYDWEEKFNNTLNSIREYIKLAKRTKHQYFFDAAMHMVETSDCAFEPMDIAINDTVEEGLHGRHVFLDMSDFKNLKLRMCANDKVIASFNEKESEKLYCIRNYNEFFRGWGHFIEKPHPLTVEIAKMRG